MLLANGISCGLILLYLSLLVLNSPFSLWNAGRLSAGISLVKGYNLYYGPQQGPILDWMYGPMGAVFYMPAAIVSEPVTAILFATVLSQLIIILPVVYLFKAYFRLEGIQFWIITSLFLGTCLKSIGVAGLFTGIHVDPPATGFALISAICLLKVESGSRCFGYFFLSAIFCGLSIWTKQTMLPLPVGLIIFVLLQHGLKTAFHFGLVLGAILVGLSSIFVGFFGANELFFEMVTYPASFGWWSSLSNPSLPLISGVSFLKRAKVCIASLLELLKETYFVSLMLVTGAYLMKKKTSRYSAFLLFLIIFFVELPMGIISRVKYGGSHSNYSTTVFFLILSAFSIWLSFLQGQSFDKVKQRRVVSPLLVIISMVLSLSELNRVYFGLWRIKELSMTKEHEAFVFSKNHPNRIYFPWYPLATLLGEGKLYHWEIGVGDRKLGKLQPTLEHFRSVFPESLTYVAFWDQDSDFTMSYFPEFKYLIKLPGLPGWKVFSRVQSPQLFKKNP